MLLYLIFIKLAIFVRGFALVLEGDDNETDEDVDHEERDDNDVDEIEDGDDRPEVVQRTAVFRVGID